MAEQKKTVPTLKNKKAFFEFNIEKTFEAGIVLQGTEVKSLRAGHASFTDSFAYIHHGEVWLKEFYIKEFDQGSYNNHDTRRERKLLLNRDEIRKIDTALRQKGYTLVPLKVYFKKGKAKVEIGLAKGKKMFDKRASIAEKDVKRETERQIKQHL
ncbi:MAG: SsrA-binding protein SmpB [Candidatus Cyclonatronum sp.]|uniref:SsrA-binding protein SmpB n=1 Tax=Cyclonatronum sp. TaxID=3024185 RepID=UPI0025B7ABB5|nr:SsrA-binding protein SmpB [Cyclonatronum sp.]MCC5933958.1 SsrA-binding protein SmpB [Balneolales bacterium]MCH8486423.1 SsrA-binding protein SmpB [Cyclonatronum sp.]